MKKITSILVSIALLISFMPSLIVSADESSAFTDVEDTEYYAGAAEALEQLDILTGYPDGTFGAEKAITRAEMAAVIIRMIDKESESDRAKGETIFDDVSAGHWASGYINTASSENIINGDGDGNFRPEDDVTYEEAVKMVVCSLGYGDDIEVNEDDWSEGYLEAADEKGITDNLRGKKGDAATRGDIAMMSYNGLTADLAAPVASLKAGSYRSTQNISLTTETSGADIYYTTDGTTPTVNSNKYTKPVSVSKTTTLKAVTVKDGILVSDVMSEEYTIRRSGGGGGSSAPLKYKLSFADAVNGTIDTSVAGSYSRNSEITLTADPADGYSFVRWESDNGGAFEDASKAVTTFTMPAKDVVITAVFEQNAESEDELMLNPDDTAAGDVSRQSWIKRLIDTVGLTMNNSNIESSYDDVENDTYLTAVEIALQNGVISDPETCSSFYPEKYATTAFAAVTTVKALGYAYESDDECFDIAEDVGIFDGASVNDNLTESEANAILEKVTQINASTEVDPSAVPVVELSENTVILDEDNSGDIEYVYEPAVNMMTENNEAIEAQITITKTPETEELTSGECILLPATEEFPGGLAQKIIGIDETASDTIVLDTITPTLDEVIGDGGEISAEGIAEIDESKFVIDEAFEDDIPVLYNTDDSINLMASFEVEEGESSIEVKADSVKVTLGKDLADMGAAEISGSVEIFFPEIEYNVALKKAFGVPIGVDDFYLAINNKVKATGNIKVEAESGMYDLFNKRLGTIPVPLAAGFSVNIVLWLGCSASGELSLSYTLETTSGIQYTNGRLRSISDCDNSLEFNPLECKAEIGPNLSAMLTWATVFDLADVTASAGIGVKGTLTMRALDSVCVDGKGYVYLNISALKNSLIGEWTGLSAQLNIWDENESIFIRDLHFEGTPSHIGVVPSCTFGDGEFKGIVKDSATNATITDFELKCYTASDGSEVNCIKNILSDGQFVVRDLPSGSYRIVINADGYKTYEKNINVYANRTEDIGSILLISNNAVDGSGSGTVIDALTGDPVSGALVELYNSGSSSGTPIAETTTTSSGTFSFTQSAGNYTIVVSKTGYSEGMRDFVITEAGASNQNVTLIPLGVEESEEGTISEIGDLRIVLTWGEYPYDLDSHLCGPTRTGTDRFHVYFSDKRYYENGILHSFLDHDDTTSYGPETTTVYDINTSGKYSFYVHDFTNAGSTSSTEMSDSGATVKVYVKEATGETAENGEALYRAKMIGCFYVPVSTGGTLWHVFDYNAATGELIRKDTMTYESNAGNVGGVSLFALGQSAELDPHVSEDIRNILEDMPEQK